MELWRQTGDFPKEFLNQTLLQKQDYFSWDTASLMAQSYGRHRGYHHSVLSRERVLLGLSTAPCLLFWNRTETVLQIIREKKNLVNHQILER